MAGNSAFRLDDEAERIFREIGGIEEVQPIRTQDDPERLLESAFEKEDQLDAVRIQLVELAHLLGSCFNDVRYWSGGKAETELLEKIAVIFDALRQGQASDDTVFIRHRGFRNGCGESAKPDYVMYFGNTMVDLATIIPEVMKRQGIGTSHLGGKLAKAFEVFANNGFNNLYLKIPDNTSVSLELWRVALRIISRFNQALKQDGVVVFEQNGKSVALPVVRNEMNEPDPNLTMLAGLNKLSTTTIRSLIEKVDTRIRQVNASASKTQIIGVYNALFAIRSLREKLARPPIEVNNIKWLIMDQGQQVVSKEKARIASFISEHFKDVPLGPSGMLDSVYGKDFNKIDSGDFGRRLDQISQLLQLLEKDLQGRQLEKDVIQNIKERMACVRDDVYDDLDVKEDKIVVRTHSRITVIDRTHQKLLDLMAFFKNRSRTRKKMRSLVQKGIDFDAEDFETLAEDFGISIADAHYLITLLKQCFDDRGYFIRSVFEKHVPSFLKYEDKVFEFLWHYLKQTPDREGRVAFLNSLQLLIGRMKQQPHAIQALLDDLCRGPNSVAFSDRNALMLSNLMLRKYNKEINLDIEITPEEVLLVRQGLDQHIIQTTARLLDTGSVAFYEKTRTIHRHILDSLLRNGSHMPNIPIRYLFSLEREAFIFLALVGGTTGLSLIRRGAEEYGDSNAVFYQNGSSRTHLPAMLQQLRVLIRALGRVGERNDLHLLEQIRSNEANFQNLVFNKEQTDMVRHITDWAERARENIIQNNSINGT